MSSLSAPTKPFTTYTQTTALTTMSKATFNFRLDTLMHEIEMHEHREELIQLLREQVADENSSY